MRKVKQVLKKLKEVVKKEEAQITEEHGADLDDWNRPTNRSEEILNDYHCALEKVSYDRSQGVYVSKVDEAKKARVEELVVPKIENLDNQILIQLALTPKNKLDMGDWHTCKTTHCLAGWAITLAGKEGKALEKELGPAVAGGLIYAESTGHVPNFYAGTQDALCDLAVRAGALDEDARISSGEDD